VYETMVIDSRTIIVKTDNEEELSEIFDFVIMRDKERNLKELLDFASSKRKVVKNYKFTRDECYAE